MSSDEVDKKNEEEMKDTASSVDEEEVKQDTKEEKTNSKAGSKKKGADLPKIKQPAKKRVKTDVEVEKKANSDEEDSDEEDAKVPLLDQPLEVTGRRRRSEVQRFKPVEKEDKEVKIPEGKGVVLGDIGPIEQNIQKYKPEDLKILHRACFGKIGKAAEVKKNLKRFNGFEFGKDSKEFEDKLSKLKTSKITKKQLITSCVVLNLEKSGNNDDLLLRMLSFLLCPEDSGEKAPAKSAKRTKKTTTPNQEPPKNKSKKKSTKGRKAPTGDTESESMDSDTDEEKHNEKNGKDVNDTVEKSTEESDQEKDKKSEKEEDETKIDKKENEDKKAPPKKRAAAKKAIVEQNSDSEDKHEDDKSDDGKLDDKPLVKKAKPSPPSDDEIKTYIKGLLDGADLEQITMKKVCHDVYTHYPEVDLTHKKDFIKTTVKNIISS